MRRLDRHLTKVNIDLDYATEAQTSGHTLARIAAVVTRARLLMSQLGYDI